MVTVRLKEGRQRSVKRFHPWIFSGAIKEIDGDPEPGQTVRIRTEGGKDLGCGAYCPRSQIRIRVWSFNRDERIDRDFFKRRLLNALEFRRTILPSIDSDAYRIVNAESDGLPGIVVDRYSDFLVCQFLTAGAEYWKGVIISLLRELIPCKGIYERSDLKIRLKEGLRPQNGILWGEEPPDRLMIYESDIRFWVDIKRGQKTGFYLDQRDNRRAIVKYSKGMDILNCFSYSGGFGIYALKAGAARVINIDSSSEALELAKENLSINSLPISSTENIRGNAFDILRDLRSSGKRFDLIVMDPPRFLDSRSKIVNACRGYKDINMLAFQMLKSGGILFTFSCSGLISPELFQKLIFDAALDAQVDAKIIGRLSLPIDHPVSVYFPEGNYLKGLILKIS